MMSAYCHLVSRKEAARIRIREAIRQQRFTQVQKSFEQMMEREMKKEKSKRR